MEKINLNLDKYRKLKTVKGNESLELAKEIYEFFGRQINFPALMAIIKRNGTQCVRECFYETQKDKPVLELFMWRIKKWSTKFK